MHSQESACRKSSCGINGMKPKMITTATTTSTRRKVKYEDKSDSDESDNSEEKESDHFEEESDSFEEDDDLEISEENESADDRDVNVSKKLHETWSRLSLPIDGSEIVGKWFAGIFKTKRSKRLYIGQLMEQFLKDENGDVDVIEMRCLRPRVGLSTVMKGTPDHLPDS